MQVDKSVRHRCPTDFFYLMCTTAQPVETEEEPEEQQAEKCPCCGESNLSYGDSGLVDSQYYYNWTCQECDAAGTQWFDLVFSEHIIKKPGSYAGE